MKPLIISVAKQQSPVNISIPEEGKEERIENMDEWKNGWMDGCSRKVSNLELLPFPRVSINPKGLHDDEQDDKKSIIKKRISAIQITSVFMFSNV